MDAYFCEDLPIDSYKSESYFKLEQKTIFYHRWLYCMPRSFVKEAGDYFATTLAGTPILIHLDKNKHLQGFINACRHRNMPLVRPGTGKNESCKFICPYHHWIYDDLGQLKNPPIPTNPRHLKKIHVEEHKGLVFVNLCEEPKAFQQDMSDLIALLDQKNISFTGYHDTIRWSVTCNFNWKLWIDGYQECYHCASVHPQLKKDFELQAYKIENKKHISIHSCPRKSVSYETGESDGLWLWLYPNLGLPTYDRCYYTLQANPVSFEQTELNYTFHFKAPCTEDEKKDFISFVQQLTKEDIHICENIQKNITHPLAKPFVFNTQKENGVLYFHELINKDYRELPSP